MVPSNSGWDLDDMQVASSKQTLFAFAVFVMEGKWVRGRQLCHVAHISLHTSKILQIIKYMQNIVLNILSKTRNTLTQVDLPLYCKAKFYFNLGQRYSCHKFKISPLHFPLLRFCNFTVTKKCHRFTSQWIIQSLNKDK